MSDRSYADGFCKAAAAAGVDPVSLIKSARGPLKGDELRKAVHALADNGYIERRHTPLSTRLKEWAMPLLRDGHEHAYYTPSYPGDIPIRNKQYWDNRIRTEAVTAPSPIRVAQTLEKHMDGKDIPFGARKAVQRIKQLRPITHRLRNAMDKALWDVDPEAARYLWQTVGETAAQPRAAGGLTDALSGGTASGRIKLPAGLQAGRAAPAAGKANILKALSRLGRFMRFR